jgi:hypothetical protein
MTNNSLLKSGQTAFLDSQKSILGAGWVFEAV